MKTIKYTTPVIGTVSDIVFTEQDAVRIFKFLISLGVGHDIDMQLTGDTKGNIIITKKFKSPILDTSQTTLPSRCYALEDYLRILVRLDKIKYKKVKNAEDKINKLFRAVTNLQEEIQ